MGKPYHASHLRRCPGGNRCHVLGKRFCALCPQTDDWIQICLIWMIFLGAQELVRTRNHFVVEVMTERLEGMTGKICRVVVCAIELLTYALICYYGWVWVMRAHAYMQSIPWMQVKVAYAAIPISAFFMSCYALRDFILAIQGRYDDFESI